MNAAVVVFVFVCSRFILAVVLVHEEEYVNPKLIASKLAIAIASISCLTLDTKCWVEIADTHSGESVIYEQRSERSITPRAMSNASKVIA